MNTPELPSLYADNAVRFLVRQVRQAARNAREERSFAAILRRARQDLLELEFLYQQLPAVLRGNHHAIDRFGEILSDVGLGLPAQHLGADHAELPLIPGEPPVPGPCEGRFVVAPSAIFALIQRLTGMVVFPNSGVGSGVRTVAWP